MSDWRDEFDVIDGRDKSWKRCKHCGEELNSRAGRARRHLRDKHGWEEGEAVRKAPPKEKKSSEPKFPRGSREWLREHTLNLIDGEGLSPSERLKAISELRDLEQFQSTGTFDDEVERAKTLEQWERAVKRAKELRDLEKKLLRDSLLRHDLLRAMQEMER